MLYRTHSIISICVKTTKNMMFHHKTRKTHTTSEGGINERQRQKQEHDTWNRKLQQAYTLFKSQVNSSRTKQSNPHSVFLICPAVICSRSSLSSFHATIKYATSTTFAATAAAPPAKVAFPVQRIISMKLIKSVRRRQVKRGWDTHHQRSDLCWRNKQPMGLGT